MELHRRKLFFNIYEECIKQNINPYFEYDKHDLIEREISNGVEMILNRNKDLKEEYIKHFADTTNNFLVFYIGER